MAALPPQHYGSDDEASVDAMDIEEPSRPLFTSNKLVVQHTVPEMFHGQHGRAAFDASKKGPGIDKPAFADHYRVKATPFAHGGSGRDENASTAYAKDHADQLRKANVAEARELIGELSSARSPTDALVWYTDKGEIGSHPGALRKVSNTQSFVQHGHGKRDIQRKKAVATEFAEIVPDIAQATHDELVEGERRSIIRAQVETVRTFSTPLEEFAKRGPTGETAFHARFGDISTGGKPSDFAKMAEYVHEHRERLKWNIGQAMGRRPDLAPHVPGVMLEYLQKHKYDHTIAQQDFAEQVAKGTETRVNKASSSQAHPIPSTETLRGRSAAASAHGQRALSPPRARKTS